MVNARQIVEAFKNGIAAAFAFYLTAIVIGVALVPGLFVLVAIKWCIEEMCK